MSTLKHADDIKGVIELSVKGLNVLGGVSAGAVAGIAVQTVGNAFKSGPVRGVFKLASWLVAATVTVEADKWLDNHNVDNTKKFLDTLI